MYLSQYKTLPLICNQNKNRRTLPTKDAFDSSNAHSINNVTCQSKWNGFWCRQDATLLKRYTKVNMNKLSCLTVYQYVLHVSVAETKNVSNCTLMKDTRTQNALVDYVLSNTQVFY